MNFETNPNLDDFLDTDRIGYDLLNDPLLNKGTGFTDHERELLEFARANMAHFKAPHSVTFVNELPKTATGKIQKYILRAQRPAIAPQ